jgi:hypothetical protein
MKIFSSERSRAALLVRLERKPARRGRHGCRHHLRCRSPVLNVLGAELHPLTPAGLRLSVEFSRTARGCTRTSGAGSRAGVVTVHPFLVRRFHRAPDAHAAGCSGPGARNPRPFGMNKIFPNERWRLFPAAVSRRCGSPELVGPSASHPSAGKGDGQVGERDREGQQGRRHLLGGQRRLICRPRGRGDAGTAAFRTLLSCNSLEATRVANERYGAEVDFGRDLLSAGPIRFC